MQESHSQVSKELEQAVKSITESFDELKNAHETATKEVSPAVKAEIEKRANEVGNQLQNIQAEQQKLKAAMERGGSVGAGGETEAQKQEKAAYDSFLRKGDRNLNTEQQKYLTTDSLPDGGYMVPTQMLAPINGRIFETSAMRGMATVIKTSQKSVEMPLDDQEASAGWAGEGDTIVETATPQLGKIEIAAKKMYAFPRMTEEMLADAAFEVEAWLQAKLADKFSRLENTAFVQGDGNSTPRGFLTYGAWNTAGVYQRNALEQFANGSASVITENGLITLQGGLKEAYQPKATWAMKRSTLVNIMLLAGTTNFRFLNLQPATGPTGQVLPSQLTLLEKPVKLFDDMPVIAANALPIAYGDFSNGYTVVDRVSINVRADPYTAPGFMKYYSTKRVGGAVTNFEAIKLLKTA